MILGNRNTILFVNCHALIAKQDFLSEVLLSSGRLLQEDGRNKILFVKLFRRLALTRFNEQSLFMALWNSSNIFLSQSCLEIVLAISHRFRRTKKGLLLLFVYAFAGRPKIVVLILTILTEMDIQHHWIYFAQMQISEQFQITSLIITSYPVACSLP
jgi:hypothetical protein